MIIGSNYDAPLRELLNSNSCGRVVDLCTGAGHWCVIYLDLTFSNPIPWPTIWVKCMPIATSFFFLFHMADAGNRYLARTSHGYINDLSGSSKWPGSSPMSNFVDLTLVRFPSN